MIKTNPEVDDFLSKVTSWKNEFVKLREIVLQCGLTEDFKWRHPCYTLDDKNILIIHGFKEYCAILFVKGVLLKDPEGILIRQTENVQAGRQIRFTGLQDVLDLESSIKAYIHEAIEVEKSGMKVPLKETEDFFVPEEFQSELDRDPALKNAFEALTPGRQKGYLLHFAAPKQSKTRVSRIEKCIPLIFDGIGLNDR